MKKNTWAIFVAILILFPILINSALSDDKKEPAGKKVFIEKKCIMCHTVNSQNITLEKPKAPDLSSVGLRLKADWIQDWITKKVKRNDKNHMIAFKGTDEEMKNLLNWLMTLKTTSPNEKK